MLNFSTELQLFVGFPKKYALPNHGGTLPTLQADASLDEQVPIWMDALECLFEDQANGSRTFAEALGC